MLFSIILPIANNITPFAIFPVFASVSFFLKPRVVVSGRVLVSLRNSPSPRRPVAVVCVLLVCWER